MSLRTTVEWLDRVLWQSYAHLYDGLLEVFTYRDMLARVADLADCAGRSVLDVGAGTGNVTRAVLLAGAGHVIAVDASRNMLDHAKAKLIADTRSGRVQIINGDAISAMSELPDASIQRIVAVNVLYALSERAQFFRQAARVLAPGGFVIASHTTRPGSGPIIRDQYRRGGLRAVLRLRLIGIALVDLVIDMLARGGRYDFAAVPVLAGEAATAGLPVTTSLGRCYGGDVDGVNELVRFAATGAPGQTIVAPGLGHLLSVAGSILGVPSS